MNPLKRKIILLGITFLMNFINQQSQGFSNRDQALFVQQVEERNKRFTDLFTLQEAKYHLINGNLKMAKFYLEKVNYGSKKLMLVKKRYQALIAFVENRFQESLKILSIPQFKKGKVYPQICMLRLVNLLALNKVRTLSKEKSNCISQTYQYSKQNSLWLDTLIEMRSKRKDLLTGDRIELLKNVHDDINYLKIWIKLALFLNREEIIETTIEELPGKAYHSKKIRELIAFALHRQGKNNLALEFIEDIETPNADNIRGNIGLKEKKYEQAFKHFQMALQKKENSFNAIARGLPLAWSLGRWQEGLNLLNRLRKSQLDIKKKMALNAAFQIRLKNFNLAYGQLNLLEVKFKGKYPPLVGLMKSYVALQRHDQKTLRESSLIECYRHDGINCWMAMRLLYWENLGQTIEREDKTLSLKDFSIEKLKVKSPINPLQEKIILDQRDIEELDSQLVTIEPQAIP